MWPAVCLMQRAKQVWEAVSRSNSRPGTAAGQAPKVRLLSALHCIAAAALPAGLSAQVTAEDACVSELALCTHTQACVCQGHSPQGHELVLSRCSCAVW